MSINYTNFHQVHEMKTGQILSKCFLLLFLFSSGETSSTCISYCTLGKEGEPKQSDYTPRPREQRKHALGEAWVFLWWSSSKAKPLACVLPAEPAAWGAFCHAARRLCCGHLCPTAAGPAGRGLGASLFSRRPGGAGGLSVRHQGQGEVRCKTGSNDLKAAKQKHTWIFRKWISSWGNNTYSPKIVTKERWWRPAQETPPTGSAPECDRRLHTVSGPPRPQPEPARWDGQEAPVLHSMSGKPTTDCGQGGGYCSHLRALPWFVASSPVSGAVGGQRRADPTLLNLACLDVFASDSEASSQAPPPLGRGQQDHLCSQPRPHHRLAPTSWVTRPPTQTLNPEWREASCAFTPRAGRPQLEGPSPGPRLWGTHPAWCSEAPGLSSRRESPQPFPSESLLPSGCLAAAPVRCPTPAEAHTPTDALSCCVSPFFILLSFGFSAWKFLTYLPAHGARLRPRLPSWLL